VQRLSSRYIAGPALDDALRVVRKLNAQGKLATIDVLGEEITSADEARAIAAQYRDVLARIDDGGLDANVSVELTSLGLGLDHAVCRENLQSVVEDARVRGNFVRIDMEDSSTTDDTLRLDGELRAAGHSNLGVVLQARLRRTLADARGLENVRLCKGIYLEPAEIAYEDPEEIRESFRATLRALLDEGGYAAIATHDEELIEFALREVRERGLSPTEYEFQMLLGVRSARGDELVRDGHRLRVYVPYGDACYADSVRRLKENPSIAGHVIRGILTGGN